MQFLEKFDPLGRLDKFFFRRLHGNGQIIDILVRRMFSPVGKKYILRNAAKPRRDPALTVEPVDRPDRLVKGLLCQFFCQVRLIGQRQKILVHRLRVLLIDLIKRLQLLTSFASRMCMQKKPDSLQVYSKYFS